MSWYSRDRDGVSSGLAGLIWLIAVVVATILVLHIILVFANASRTNDGVDFIADAARNLAWIFRGMFHVDNEKTQVLLNYGVAALVYLGVARLIGYAARG